MNDKAAVLATAIMVGFWMLLVFAPLVLLGIVVAFLLWIMWQTTYELIKEFF